MHRLLSCISNFKSLISLYLGPQMSLFNLQTKCSDLYPRPSLLYDLSSISIMSNSFLIRISNECKYDFNNTIILTPTTSLSSNTGSLSSLRSALSMTDSMDFMRLSSVFILRFSLVAAFSIVCLISISRDSRRCKPALCGASTLGRRKVRFWRDRFRISSDRGHTPSSPAMRQCSGGKCLRVDGDGF